jgi:hypothetical protein
MALVRKDSKGVDNVLQSADGGPRRLIRVRKPDPFSMNPTMASDEYQIEDGPATANDALCLIEHIMRTRYNDMSGRLMDKRASLDSKYEVVDWLFSYHRYLDHESYKYMMRKMMSTMTIQTVTGENQWIQTAQHKSNLVFKFITFLRLYVNASCIPKGEF